jgi:uncharacterized membrane-anchored protein YhcB (DUF1043 family)
MSIEKYLNEIDNEVAMEGDVGTIGLLLGIIGATGLFIYKNLKNEYAEIQKKKNGNLTKQELEKKKEEVEHRYNYSKEKLVSLVISDIKKMLSKINQEAKIKDSKISLKIQESIKSFKENYPEKHYSEKYKLSMDMSDMGDDSGYIYIIEADQVLTNELSWILQDIADALKIKYKDEIATKFLHIGTGDGDEGCIYINDN